MSMQHTLGHGMTDHQLSMRPMCNDCGWRMGGLDSWNGGACKCGKQSPTFGELFQAAEAARVARAHGAKVTS